MTELFRIIIKTLVSTFLIMASVMVRELNGQRLSRDLNVDLITNQAGYVPNASKIFVTKGLRTGNFEIINTETLEVVYTGKMNPSPGDFGDYSTGNFSAVNLEGHYYIKADTLRSYPFAISRMVYNQPMNLIVGYFSLQRCGASTTGYLTPCHLDDGVRMDNGKHQDVSGGWHDASDLRRRVSNTIYGIIGLGKAYELLDDKYVEKEKILDELMWGNKFFLKMQEPQGFVMNCVGCDVLKHSDSNRWTNNVIEAEGGKLAFVKPTAGASYRDMLIFGTQDDRVIKTDTGEISGQFNFITSEAIMARITKRADREYSQKCLLAAEKCFNWSTKANDNTNTRIIGSAILASIEMFKTTGLDVYKNYAVEQADYLKRLQVNDQNSTVSGFFKTASTDPEPQKDVKYGCLELISLCDLIETFPGHKDAASWKVMINEYANNYLAYFSRLNSFGIVPYGLFLGGDPGGNRKIGNYWYRYFMNPGLSWWVGINANLASAGIGLMKAARVLNDPGLRTYAQRQLDWIIGANPFNSSTIISVGYNHPKQMVGSEFHPFTPLLPGAVMNGLGGDKDDQPATSNGNYNMSEYWTPMVAYTLWLMAEISMTE